MSSCERFLDVTQHQGIVYVSDARALSSCDYDGTLLYQLTVSVIGHNRTSLINVRLNNVSLSNNSSPGESHLLVLAVGCGSLVVSYHGDGSSYGLQSLLCWC